MDVSILFNPGLYKIICLKNKKIYIGQSSNLISRIGRHCDNLQNNKHDCRQLQNDFNKFGKQKFVFLALEQNLNYKDDIFRKTKENEFIKQIPKKFRYNIIDSKQDYYAVSVQIDAKIYSSLTNASLVLNQSRTQL